MNPDSAAAIPADDARPDTLQRFGVSPGLLAAAGLAIVHLVVLLAHFAPAIMSPDANGYVVQARLIAEQGRTSFSTVSPVQYVGMHWLETADGVFHSRYPAGFPVLMAVAWKIGGLTAALLVNPLLASATVLLVFFLARRLMAPAFALVAAAVVAALPVANQHALDADAHTSVMFFLVAGVLALLRFGETRSVRGGLLAGVLLGMVPAIRYPEAITGLAIALWLGWRMRTLTRAWPAFVGAALPIGAVLIHNTAAYGAFWRTGYALTNEQTGFGVEYFSRHALSYLQNLGGTGLALFFGFGAAGLAALAAERRTRGEGLLYAGIVVPLVVVYMAYYFGGPGGAGVGNLRFLIPTFPFFAVAGAWLLAGVVAHLGRAGFAAASVVVALQLLVTGAGTFEGLARTKTSLAAAASARLVAEKHIAPGSVVIADRLLAESLDAVGTWRMAEENLIAGIGPRMGPGAGAGFRPAAMERNERPLGEERPMPMQVGKNRAQRERYAGLNPSQRRGLAWEDVVAWAGDQPIYWFARSVDAVANALPPGADYESIAETDAPGMAGMGGPGPGPGLPGGGGFARGGRPGFAKGGVAPGGPMPGPRAEPGMFPPGGDGFRSPLGMSESAPKLRLVRIILPKA